MTTHIAVGRVRLRGWERVTRGVYRIRPREETTNQLLLAWQAALPPGACFTHLTAAEARGWWLPPRVEGQPIFAIAPGNGQVRRPGSRVSRTTLPLSFDLLDGVRVATPAEILLAAARDLGLLDLVMLADSALHAGACTVEDLVSVSAQRRPGSRQLKLAIPLLDERSESPWESILRVLHHAAGVVVQPQRVISDAQGRFIARGDLWLVGTRRLHEYDGGVHRDPRQQARDLERDRALLDAGWQRYGYTARAVLRSGAEIIRDADAALGRAWDPTRLANWQALLAESAHTPAGRARLSSRWNLT